MYEFIASLRNILNFSFHHLVDVRLVLGADVIEPREVLQELLLGRQVGDGRHGAHGARPNLQPIQLVLLEPHRQEAALGLVHPDHRAVFLHREEDRLRVAGYVDAPHRLPLEISHQVVSLQLVERDGIDLLYGESELLHVGTVDRAIVHEDKDRVAKNLVLLVPDNGLGKHI